MTKNTLMKQIHQAMRKAGYSRSKIGNPAGVHSYRTAIISDLFVVVIVNGAWSLPRREEFRINLLNILDQFHPSPLDYAPGVEIRFDANGVIVPVN